MSSINLIGEYECRLDNKCRIILPSSLKKQLPPDANEQFVINRGFEGCLVLYPHQVWLETSTKLKRLNEFRKASREFIRWFSNGAMRLNLDNQNRLLLPKKLLDEVSIDKEIILFAFGDKIEVWDKKRYEEQMVVDPEKFADLAEKVMGDKNESSTGHELP